MVDFLLPWEIIPIVSVDTVTPCPICPTTTMIGTTGIGITIDDQVIVILIALVVGYLIHEVL